MYMVFQDVFTAEWVPIAKIKEKNTLCLAENRKSGFLERQKIGILLIISLIAKSAKSKRVDEI